MVTLVTNRKVQKRNSEIFEKMGVDILIEYPLDDDYIDVEVDNEDSEFKTKVENALKNSTLIGARNKFLAKKD